MHLNLFPKRKEFKQLSKQGNLIPVCVELLADTETPVTAFSKFKTATEPAFLLESVEGGERWSRFSFLGTSCQRLIKVFKDNVKIVDEGSEKDVDHKGDPLSVLRTLLSEYKPVSLPQLPRFWGGAVGYFTYEMVSFFEDIPNAWPEEKPLASFMITDNLIIFDNVRHVIIIIAHAFLDGKSDPDQVYDQSIERLEKMLEKLARPLPGDSDIPSCIYELKPAMKPEQFRQAVSTIKNHIIEGDIIQAVISQPFVCDCPPDPLLFYRVQRYVNPSPYLYFLRIDDCTLVGSSPETMVHLENGVATVRPIAGTRPRGRNPREDRNLAAELLEDPKERAEHLMLVDLGRNDLGKVAEVGTVQVTDLMFIERYSHVMHLVSNVNCYLDPEYDAWDLFKATFPAGTLTGAPKIRAMEIISELELAPRGPYGGAVGYVSFTGNMDFAITIRTGHIEDDKLVVQAGAGIVADSVPERERVESVNKAKALEKALHLINRNNVIGPLLELLQE